MAHRALRRTFSSFAGTGSARTVTHATELIRLSRPGYSGFACERSARAPFEIAFFASCSSSTRCEMKIMNVTNYFTRSEMKIIKAMKE